MSTKKSVRVYAALFKISPIRCVNQMIWRIRWQIHKGLGGLFRFWGGREEVLAITVNNPGEKPYWYFLQCKSSLYVKPWPPGIICQQQSLFFIETPQSAPHISKQCLGQSNPSPSWDPLGEVFKPQFQQVNCRGLKGKIFATNLCSSFVCQGVCQETAHHSVTREL